MVRVVASSGVPERLEGRAQLIRTRSNWKVDDAAVEEVLDCHSSWRIQEEEGDHGMEWKRMEYERVV